MTAKHQKRLLKSILIIALSVSPAFAQQDADIARERDEIADLVRRADLCEAHLATCELSFQKAVEKNISLQWYQDPLVIVLISGGSAILGAGLYSAFGR